MKKQSHDWRSGDYKYSSQIPSESNEYKTFSLSLESQAKVEEVQKQSDQLKTFKYPTELSCNSHETASCKATTSTYTEDMVEIKGLLAQILEMKKKL